MRLAALLLLLSSNLWAADSIVNAKNSGQMFLKDNDGRTLPAMVVYTTDGNNNIIPIAHGLLMADVNITNPFIPVTQTGVWSVGRTWSLLNSSDSVTSYQGGAWSLGRTWNLSFGSDTADVSGSAVSVTNFPATQPISAVTLPLPTGAATAANQATANASLASIDGKLANPMPVSQSTSPWVTSRNWTLLNSTDSVNAVQSGSWSVNQAGSWTTGRTWTLLNSTDSVNAVQSGTWTVQQGGAPWSVSQSGTWNLNNISGTISLPTGASTAANQTTANTSLSSIDGKLPALVSGRVPVDGSGVTQPISAASLPLPSGASTAANQTTANTSLASIDTKTPALVSGRQPVDGSGVTQPISAASLPLPAGAATATNQGLANISLASIDTKLTAPLSVTTTQPQNIWKSVGYVATASVTKVQVSATGFTYEAVNADPYIASASANDTLAGTGCQKLSYTYFKSDGSGPFTATDNMQGTTGFFSSAGTNVSIIQYAYCSQVGSGGTNAGTILMSDLSPLGTMASILAGDTEVFNANHVCPLGKTCYVTDFGMSSTSTTVARSAQFEVRYETMPIVSNPYLTLTGQRKWSGTDSGLDHGFRTPLKVTGPAIITVTVTPFTTTADTWYAYIGGYEQ